MRHSNDKYFSINDLTDLEFDIFRSNYIKTHSKIIEKYFSFIERSFLNDSFICKIFCKNQSLKSSNTMIESEYRFSNSKILIPYEFNIVSEILLKSNLDKKGIFRINGTGKNIASFIEIIKAMGDKRIDEEIGLNMIRNMLNHTNNINNSINNNSNININNNSGNIINLIDVCESYKLFFKKLETPVIPEKMYKMAEKIQKIKNKEDKEICTKVFLFSIPKINRMILENCVFTCTEISNRLEKTDEKEKMNLKGLSVVMMPNLMRLQIEKIDNLKVKELSDFTSYLFENFKGFMKV